MTAVDLCMMPAEQSIFCPTHNLTMKVFGAQNTKDVFYA